MNTSTDEFTTLTALSTPDSRHLGVEDSSGISSDNFSRSSRDFMDVLLAPEEYSVYFHIGTVVRVLLCLVGACLCSFVLYALQRFRNPDLTSTWFVSYVLATDLFLSIRHFYLAITIYFKHPMILVVGFLLDYWTTLPALLSVLSMGLDQLLVVLFPLQMRTKCSDTLKKVLYSALVWLPSLLITLVVVVLWLKAGNFSAMALAVILTGKYNVFVFHVLTLTGLNVLVYMLLITRVLFFTMSTKLRGRQLDNAAIKQRRLIMIFCVVFFTTILFVTGPFAIFTFIPICLSDDYCLTWRLEILQILMVLNQLNSVCDPLYIFWRFRPRSFFGGDGQT